MCCAIRDLSAERGFKEQAGDAAVRAVIPATRSAAAAPQDALAKRPWRRAAGTLRPGRKAGDAP